MTEAEEMRKYAEAHGFGELRMPELTDEQLKRLREEMERQPIHIEPDSPVRPLPCVRAGKKIIKNCTDKEHFAKIDEELNELKEAVRLYHSAGYGNTEHIAEEAADTITAITTMLEALGIGAEMRTKRNGA